jgi:mannosyltransferase
MDLLRRAGKYVPSTSSLQLPIQDEKSKKPTRGGRIAQYLALFRRPMRLKGNSSISVPLGVLLIFPVIVIILILTLFLRHPNSPGRMLMPAGAPPAIRYASQGSR